MSVSALRRIKHQPIDNLEIVSLDGRYYMARFRIATEWYALTDEHDEIIAFPAACAAREAFQQMHIHETEVIAAAGTDEMIGMPVTPAEPMKIPL